MLHILFTKTTKTNNKKQNAKKDEKISLVDPEIDWTYRQETWNL